MWTSNSSEATEATYIKRSMPTWRCRGVNPGDIPICSRQIPRPVWLNQLFSFFDLIWRFTSESILICLCRASQLTYANFSWAGLVLLAIDQYFVHILVFVTENCPSWISWRERQFDLEFYNPVNSIMVILSQCVKFITLFPGQAKSFKQLTILYFCQ